MYPPPLDWLFTITAGILGAMVGSFLNVCIHRLPCGHLSIVTPRSHCPNCGKTIAWYDNIPLLSWLLLAGACRHCRNPISPRYLLVELLTAALFVIYTRWIILAPLPHFMVLPPFQRWLVLIIAFFIIGHMIIITFIDIAYRIIPDGLTYPGIILAPIISACCPIFHPEIPLIANPHLAGAIAALVGILVGGGSLYIVGVIGKLVFRKDAMGFGDVKMMAMVGGLLGWDSALIIFFVACIIGTFLGIFLLLVTRDRYTPFGPYLAIGTLLTFLVKPKILYLCFTLWPQSIARWLHLPLPTGF